MRASAISGIVFANLNDSSLKKLTTKRSMASVPFGARYRLIDFSLSNLVNAGVFNVGIITKENYHSLMDHIGSGIYWDLDRKNGGLHLLPPYLTSGVKRYSGTVDALNGAMGFMKRCKSDYIVICNTDVLINADIAAAVQSHIDREADITLIYNNGDLTNGNSQNMLLKVDGKERITDIDFKSEECKECAYAVGITIIGRELLMKLVKEAYENDIINFNHDVIAKKTKQLKICGFKHHGYVAFMDGTDSYYDASMDLLNPEVRRQLFNIKRPIFTKTRDDMPTRYGIDAKTENCLIADGCVINGTVKNSILFRGVKVEKGAVIENSILMQETSVGKDAQIEYVIADKNAVIGDNTVFKGTNKNKFFIKKNQTI